MVNRRYTLYQHRTGRRRPPKFVVWTGAALLLAALSWLVIDHSEFSEVKTALAPVKPPTPRSANALHQTVATPARAATNPPVPAPAVMSPQRVSARSGVRPVRDVIEAQIALDRIGISCGSIDGVAGSQTRRALEAFQRALNLPRSGQLDAATRERLLIAEPVFSPIMVTADDLGSLRAATASWLEKSRQDRLGHATMLELLAERAHSHPAMLVRLNPGLDWDALAPGAVIKAPRIDPLPAGRASRVRILLGGRTLQAFDEQGALIAHFPCSIAQRVDKRPAGELRVTNLAPSPDYTFDPALFTESPEARGLAGKLKLPPGPNSPVGTAWIGLDRPGYGIHGTPNPEAVGRTESHGCFRLSNWNAERLLRLAWVGLPVSVEP